MSVCVCVFVFVFVRVCVSVRCGRKELLDDDNKYEAGVTACR